MSPTQLTLGFAAAPPSLAQADFIETASNQAALAWLRSWPDWPTGRLCLFGPPGAGLSHLAALFQAQAGALPVAASRLRGASLPGLLAKLDRARFHLVLDDADSLPDEPALLHLLNLAAEAGGSVLLTARRAPAHWPLKLPDLRSRLAASPAVALGIPGQDLLRLVLAKAAAERQLALPQALLDWLAARLPRDLSAAAAAVAALDRRLLASNRRPTLADAQAALAEASARDRAPDHEAPPPVHEIAMTSEAGPCPAAPALL
jgi:chromosomal replication initiation ATPase DnaA